MHKDTSAVRMQSMDIKHIPKVQEIWCYIHLVAIHLCSIIQLSAYFFSW